MKIVVNGEARTLPDRASAADAVAAAAPGAAPRVAVARNGDVVPRSAWAGTRLADGDTIDVVAAIQGGAR